jgi:predicted Rossmann fold nucleotide-binding protein DprA/Smf involved in DNA uptake
MSSVDVACPACLRRTWLLGQVAGGLEVAHSRRRPIRSALALEEDALIGAVCGGTGLRERLASAPPVDLLAAAAEADLDVVCRHTAAYPEQLHDDAAPPSALFVRGGDDARERLVRLVGPSDDDPVLSWRSRGTNALLRDGATLIRDVQDAAELVLGTDGAAEALKRAAGALVAPPTTLAPGLRALLTAVEDGHNSVGALAPDPAGAATVRAGLAELELLGLVRRTSGGRVTRTTRAVAS